MNQEASIYLAEYNKGGKKSYANLLFKINEIVATLLTFQTKLLPPTR